MPQLSSPLSTPAGMPLVNSAHLAKAAGLHVTFPTLAALHAAVAAEGASYPDGQRLATSEEADSGADRIYRTSLGHARTAMVGGRRIDLASDTSLVRGGTAAPENSLGADGDAFVNTVLGTVYTKTGGVWTLVS